jgi:hypothetical protein
MKKIVLLLIATTLMILGCESRKQKQIKAMMEVGEYSPAIVMLNEELLDDVKNVNFREMLIECYVKLNLWNDVIKQIEIMGNIDYSHNYDFLLMRSYSLSNQIEKANNIAIKYPNYEDSLTIRYKKKIIEKVKKIKIHSDSLRDIQSWITKVNPDTLDEYMKPFYTQNAKFFDGDSLLEKKFNFYSTRNESLLTKMQLQFYKQNNLHDWYLVDILTELNDDSPYVSGIEDQITTIVQIDSTYSEYLYTPLISYMNNLIKPDLYDRKYGSYGWGNFYSDMRKYHKNQSIIFKLLKQYEKALEEKESEIYWLECDREYKYSNKDISLYSLYEEYIAILEMMNDLQNIVHFINDKTASMKKSDFGFDILTFRKNEILNEFAKKK